jgi:hypothetical protein
MSLFVGTKHSPINPEFLAKMRDNWRQWALSADVIVIVGAQPYFQDAHIWDPIVESGASVWYIGGTGGDFDLFATRLGDRLNLFGDRFAVSLNVLLGRLRELRDNSLIVAPPK